jgi:hypothetical protein
MLLPLADIVRNTPLWVWAVLAALIVAGIRQSVARRLRLARVIGLPMFFVALSLAGVIAAFGLREAALTAWALGLGLAAALAVRRGAPAGARWLPAERAFEVPGAWWPLALLLGVFALRFAVAVQLALHPGASGAAGFAGFAALGYGAASGLFLGRALALARLART